MTVLFDFYEAPPKEGEENTFRVYARPVLASTVNTERVAAIIQERCSLTETDIIAALHSLGQVVAEQLQDGRRVHLEGLGYFSLSLECHDIQTRKDMRADRVSVKSIKFQADKELKGLVMQTKAERSNYRSHSARLTNEEMDRRVAEHFEENNIMTRRDFQRFCQVKKGLAFKHIHRLLEEGKIKNINTLRQPIYVKGQNTPEG